MDNLTIFDHEVFGMVRALVVDGAPWFVARDVAVALGYANTREAIGDHCKGGRETLLPSKGGTQLTKIIPESDLYRLVMRSNLPKAVEFQDWVCYDVLPALRKTGSYSLTSEYDTTDELSIVLKAALDNRQAMLRNQQAIAALASQQELSDFRQEETDDRIADLERRHFAQPGEMSALSLANHAGWRSRTGGAHNLAVILAAINARFGERDLMHTQKTIGPLNKFYEEFIFTPAGVAAFVDEIDAQYESGAHFVVRPNDYAKANGRKNRGHVWKD